MAVLNKYCPLSFQRQIVHASKQQRILSRDYERWTSVQKHFFTIFGICAMHLVTFAIQHVYFSIFYYLTLCQIFLLFRNAVFAETNTDISYMCLSVYTTLNLRIINFFLVFTYVFFLQRKFCYYPKMDKALCTRKALSLKILYLRKERTPEYLR